MLDPNFVCYCNLCGGELYLGDACYRFDDTFVCKDCLGDYAKQYFKIHLELL